MGDILNLVWNDAEKKGFSKISKIELTVGTLSQAMPAALEMAFLVYKEEYRAIFEETAELVIDIEEAIACCDSCYHQYTPDYRITICPECGMPTGSLLKGETFQVKTYEGK